MLILMNLKFKNLWMGIGLIQILIAFYLCLRPMPETVQTIQHLDKLYHFTAYALLTWYQIQIFGTQKSKTLLFIFIIFMTQGLLIEILQFLTGYRSFELLDMVANASGSLYAILFCLGFNLKILNRIEKLTLKN
jgi:VanZ family protein